MTALHQLIQHGAEDAELVLVDVVGPNLGAINRSVLIASDHVCLPLAPDLFSLQGLKNLGPTLRDWRSVWTDLMNKAPADLPMPKGLMQPIGYIVMQHGILDKRPVKAYKRWVDRIPSIYREVVLGEDTLHSPIVADDPYCLSLLKHYRSLMPMAMEVRKPIFFLTTGTLGNNTHVSGKKRIRHRAHREHRGFSVDFSVTSVCSVAKKLEWYSFHVTC